VACKALSFLVKKTVFGHKADKYGTSTEQVRNSYGTGLLFLINSTPQNYGSRSPFSAMMAGYDLF
jgi:hypothetical protein